MALPTLDMEDADGAKKIAPVDEVKEVKKVETTGVVLPEDDDPPPLPQGQRPSLNDFDDDEPTKALKPKAAPTTRRVLSPIEQLEVQADQAREERARAKQAIIDAGKAHAEAGKRLEAEFERRLQELRNELSDRRKQAEEGHLNELERLAALADDANSVVQAKKKEIDDLKRAEAQAEADRRKAEAEAAERRERLLKLAASVQASGDPRATITSFDPPPIPQAPLVPVAATPVADPAPPQSPVQTATPTSMSAASAAPNANPASNGTSGGWWKKIKESF